MSALQTLSINTENRNKLPVNSTGSIDHLNHFSKQPRSCSILKPSVANKLDSPKTASISLSHKYPEQKKEPATTTMKPRTHVSPCKESSGNSLLTPLSEDKAGHDSCRIRFKENLDIGYDSMRLLKEKAYSPPSGKCNQKSVFSSSISPSSFSRIGKANSKIHTGSLLDRTTQGTLQNNLCGGESGGTLLESMRVSTEERDSDKSNLSNPYFQNQASSIRMGDIPPNIILSTRDTLCDDSDDTFEDTPIIFISSQKNLSSNTPLFSTFETDSNPEMCLVESPSHTGPPSSASPRSSDCSLSSIKVLETIPEEDQVYDSPRLNQGSNLLGYNDKNKSSSHESLMDKIFTSDDNESHGAETPESEISSISSNDEKQAIFDDSNQLGSLNNDGSLCFNTNIFESPKIHTHNTNQRKEKVLPTNNFESFHQKITPFSLSLSPGSSFISKEEKHLEDFGSLSPSKSTDATKSIKIGSSSKKSSNNSLNQIVSKINFFTAKPSTSSSSELGAGSNEDNKRVPSSSSSTFSLYTSSPKTFGIDSFAILLFGIVTSLFLPTIFQHYNHSDFLIDLATVAALILIGHLTKRGVWGFYRVTLKLKQKQNLKLLKEKRRLSELSSSRRWTSQEKSKNSDRSKQQKHSKKPVNQSRIMWSNIVHTVYFFNTVAAGAIAVFSPLFMGNIMMMVQEKLMNYGNVFMSDTFIAIYVVYEIIQGISNLAQLEIESSLNGDVEKHGSRKQNKPHGNRNGSILYIEDIDVLQSDSDSRSQSEEESAFRGAKLGESISQLDHNLKEMASRLISNENAWESEIETFWRNQSATLKRVKSLENSRKRENEIQAQIQQQLTILQQKQQELIYRLQENTARRGSEGNDEKSLNTAATGLSKEKNSRYSEMNSKYLVIENSDVNRGFPNNKFSTATAVVTNVAGAGAKSNSVLTSNRLTTFSKHDIGTGKEGEKKFHKNLVQNSLTKNIQSKKKLAAAAIAATAAAASRLTEATAGGAGSSTKNMPLGTGASTTNGQEGRKYMTKIFSLGESIAGSEGAFFLPNEAPHRAEGMNAKSVATVAAIPVFESSSSGSNESTFVSGATVNTPMVGECDLGRSGFRGNDNGGSLMYALPLREWKGPSMQPPQRSRFRLMLRVVVLLLFWPWIVAFHFMLLPYRICFWAVRFAHQIALYLRNEVNERLTTLLT